MEKSTSARDCEAGIIGWSNFTVKPSLKPSYGSKRATLSPSVTSTGRVMRMKRLGASCSATPADWMRNTNGPAEPSMIGSSAEDSSTVGIVDA